MLNLLIDSVGTDWHRCRSSQSVLRQFVDITIVDSRQDCIRLPSEGEWRNGGTSAWASHSQWSILGVVVLVYPPNVESVILTSAAMKAMCRPIRDVGREGEIQSRRRLNGCELDWWLRCAESWEVWKWQVCRTGTWYNEI